MTSTFTCSIEPIDLTDSLDAPALRELSDLCCFALDQEEVSGDWDISLVFTTDEHLSQLHAEFMGILEPTDIMTFPTDDALGGDIVISVDQADRQRHDDGWDLAAELRFLVAHGALHLAGWDDATATDRANMLNRQRLIIAAFQSSPPSSSR